MEDSQTAYWKGFEDGKREVVSTLLDTLSKSRRNPNARVDFVCELIDRIKSNTPVRVPRRIVK